ncbi:CynX/NimT family MFS transporter [Tessaracoccus antarcticus]|nr:MFS transporter [Tessaracoccus antarcticus]
MQTRRPSRDTTIALIAILLLAFNLRPLATSVGPVLKQITADLSMGGALAGLLTSLPALCFAVFGALAPSIASRIGAHRTIGIALVALVVGQGARAWAPSAGLFLLFSVVALGGMALSNVLLPSLVRLHFPQRIGLATSLYSLSLTLGVTAASAATYPLAVALGGWRAAFTATTAIGLAALLCWLPMLRYAKAKHSTGPVAHHYSVASVARTRMGWAIAVMFGIQSAQAYTIFGWLPTIYIDAGLSEVSAGLMLGIATGAGIIPSFFTPIYASRKAEPVGLFLLIMAFLVAGYLGLWLAPTTLPWLWAIFLAFGTASFPLILALLGLRSRTASGTAALSGFAQSVGYLIAASGPFIVGVLHARTENWSWSIGFQLILVIPMTFVGIKCCRTWFIEDELPSGPPDVVPSL